MFSPVYYDSKKIERIMSSGTQNDIHWLNLFGDSGARKDAWE